MISARSRVFFFFSQSCFFVVLVSYLRFHQHIGIFLAKPHSSTCFIDTQCIHGVIFAMLLAGLSHNICTIEDMQTRRRRREREEKQQVSSLPLRTNLSFYFIYTFVLSILRLVNLQQTANERNRRRPYQFKPLRVIALCEQQLKSSFGCTALRKHRIKLLEM